MDENINQNQSPAPVMPSEPRHAIGPLIGAGIVIALVILGGLYFWGAKLNDMEQNVDNPPYILGDDADSTEEGDATEGNVDQAAAAAINAALPPQSGSDDTSAIDADLKAMDINGLTSQTSGDVSAFGSETQ